MALLPDLISVCTSIAVYARLTRGLHINCRLQARTCYTRYNEFYKCKALKDEDDPECKMHQRAYRTLCPGDWVEKWNEQRDEGTW